MMLAMHKNIQEKAHEEAISFFEGCNGGMNFQDVNNLPYLEMVLKETMRLFPPASMVGRYSTGTVELGCKDFYKLFFRFSSNFISQEST